jgi:transcription termination/antitermination protein NusA
MKSEFLTAITQLSAEKNLPRDVVLEAVEAALASAYKKDNLASADLAVKIDSETGAIRVYMQKTVAEEVLDSKVEMTLEEARSFRPDAQLGDVIDIEVTPHNAGRIAAQTAKQVVLQRLREAEREVVFEEYSGKEGDIVSGVVQRLEGRNVIIDLGKTEAVLPPPEQARTEHYRPGQRLKLYLLDVFKATKGPQVLVSRTHKNLLRRLFELEVPEIYKGIVELKAIAREPGYRSKVAVTSRQEGVDPVGACVGLRGIRIQNIVNELNGERIDVVQWDQEPARFVANALSPAQVLSVIIRLEENTAEVVVPDRQLSLAIGKEGQNARLAAKLTGWRVDIKSQTIAEQEAALRPPEEAPAGVLAEPVPAAQKAAPALAAKPEPAGIAAIEKPKVLTPEEEAVLAFQGEAAAPEAPAEPAAVAAAESPAKPQIRFAEELLAPAAARSEVKGKRAKAKKGGRVEEPEAEAAKPKKARRARRPVVLDEEELEGFEEGL